METIIDADALVGLFNNKSVHSPEALRIVGEINKQNGCIFLLPTTLGEFAGVFAKEVGLAETKQAVDNLLTGNISILEVSTYLTTQAVAIFQKQGSRSESLFDCYVMAAAKMLNITHIFSFDKGYKKTVNGFALISDIL